MYSIYTKREREGGGAFQVVWSHMHNKICYIIEKRECLLVEKYADETQFTSSEVKLEKNLCLNVTINIIAFKHSDNCV